ncbi:BglG family transcription antiterminator [Halobacillus fulvus]|nr:BglG family transcription antiterminator [Halobacillus fulvus]
MVLDKRRAHLLSILQQADSPVPIDVLVEKTGVSQRTIYYDIDQINYWLSEQSLSLIYNQRSEGFYLPEDAKQETKDDETDMYNKWHYHFSPVERELLIKSKLLLDEKHASIPAFMELTGMSRGTVAKSIKKIKQEFSEQQIDLRYIKGQGYHLEGAEETKRRILSDIISSALTFPEWENVRREILPMVLSDEQKEEEQRSSVKSLIFKAEKDLGLTLTDEMVEFLSLHILITIKRIRSEKIISIDDQEKEVLQQAEAFQPSLRLCKELEKKWDIEFPLDEVCFLTMNLLGSKVQHDDFSRYKSRELKGLRSVVQRMIAEFQDHACVLFDDKKGLEDNLLTHIKPAYYRLKYGVRISNHLSQNIKDNYPDIFLLTKKVMKHLEYYVGMEIPEEEVTYITLHFGGWLVREEKSVEIKYRAVIVCENGIGTSNMLKTQLENLIAGLDITATVSMREYQSSSYNDVDLIFSTNFIKEESIPVIHLPAILTNYEKQQVMEKVHDILEIQEEPKDHVSELLDIIRRSATIHNEAQLRQDLASALETNTSSVKEVRKPMLTDLLKENTLQLKDNVEDWEEAIRVAATPLYEDGSIEQDYIEAMIRNVKELGPYIVLAPRIALPHARPEEGVNQLGMSLLRLKEPVRFSEQEKHSAQLIIVLAAIDNQTHLKALAQLTNILGNEEAVDQLIEAETKERLMEIIEHHYAEAS